jgi:hypothetical protein
MYWADIGVHAPGVFKKMEIGIRQLPSTYDRMVLGYILRAGMVQKGR